MNTARKPVAALFVDRSSQQWVVRDPEGNFWIIPSGKNPWENRQPFYPTKESELEPAPGHHIYMLDLPFLPKEGVPMSAEQIRLKEAREQKTPCTK
jgi:hypothetical protein